MTVLSDGYVRLPSMSTRGPIIRGISPLVTDEALAVQLSARGSVRVPAHFASRADAWEVALHVATRAYGLRAATAVAPALEVVGEFNLPPDHADQRDFQALHHDFGVPRLGADPVAVALYTALYLDPERTSSEAATRIVPLRQLLQQREWPARAVITDRLRSSTRDDSPVEGILARIVESVDLATDLPPQG